MPKRVSTGGWPADGGFGVSMERKPSKTGFKKLLAADATVISADPLIERSGAPIQICNRRWPAPTDGGGPDGAPARRFGVRLRCIIPS